MSSCHLSFAGVRRCVRVAPNGLPSFIMSSVTAEASPPAADSPREIYEQRLQRFSARAVALRRSERHFSRVRVFIFVVAVCLASICIGDSTVSWLWLLLPAGVFGALLPFHSRCIRRLRRCAAVQRFYEGCLDRVNDNWKSRSQNGARFSDASHPWTLDLDIFGPGSLFQLVTECRTGPGHRRLADWMRQTPSVAEIHERQIRAQSLQAELDLREAMAIIPDDVNWLRAEQLLRDWVRAPAERIPVWIVWASALLGLLSIPVTVGVVLGELPVSALLGLMILQGPLMMMTRRQIQTMFASIDEVDHALLQLSQVLGLLETHTFRNSSVLKLQSVLIEGHQPASRFIHRLTSLTRWLNHSLRNQFFAPIAWMGGLLVLLTDTLERWRQQHGHNVEEWLSATAEFEALLSVAAFRFEHPNYVNPDVAEDTVRLEAQELGHPLLRSDLCVRNDVTLTAEIPLMLISGSNMSGKSTLLRSVGTNLVLTYCGAVVNAKSMTTYPFQLATAMRVNDSLQEGRSLFFSVVQRLKSVVDLTQKDRTVLFLLDEILHGTNSHDRRRGAEGVIRSLVDRGALGMVTTHDLALTAIVDSLNGRAVNKHFEDTVTNGKMTFDYLLRDGVVQRSNALELMRMLGLDV